MIKIFCPVWGEKHIGLLSSALGMSLSWPKNKAMVHDAEWVIVTDSEQSLARISQILFGFFKDVKITPIIRPEINSVRFAEFLIGPVIETAKACLVDKKPMLMATPDFIYADGTIEAFSKIAHEPGSCASIAHLRVLPEIMSQITGPMENKKLMSLAREFAHTTWIHAELGLKHGNTYKGGISWLKVTEHDIAVQHYLPSPFFVNFAPRDIESFTVTRDGFPASFGIWDHNWPSELIEQGRLRFIGSNELAMMIEVTDEDRNRAPLNRSADKGFYRNHLHNKIQKQFISHFKSAE